MKHRHLFWIMELFVWLLILFAVAGGIILARYNYKKQFNTYQIFLPDVDGLIVGSPVRMMGIHVGYISQLDIVGEDIYVKFIITSPQVKIPPKSIATVEFSGLGGSKSLEIYPPTKNTVISDRYIISQPPKRIHDSLGLLNDMFNKIIGITTDVSGFADQIEKIKQDGNNNGNLEQMTPSEFVNYSDNWLNKADGHAKEFNNFLKNMDKKTAKFRNGAIVNGNGNNK